MEIVFSSKGAASRGRGDLPGKARRASPCLHVPMVARPARAIAGAPPLAHLHSGSHGVFWTRQDSLLSTGAGRPLRVAADGHRPAPVCVERLARARRLQRGLQPALVSDDSPVSPTSSDKPCRPRARSKQATRCTSAPCSAGGHSGQAGAGSTCPDSSCSNAPYTFGAPGRKQRRPQMPLQPGLDVGRLLPRQPACPLPRHLEVGALAGIRRPAG